MKINKKWLWVALSLGAVTAALMFVVSAFFGVTVSPYGNPVPEGYGSVGSVSQGIAMPMMDRIAEAPSSVMMPPYYPQDDALNVDQRVYSKSSSYSAVADNVAGYMQQVRAYAMSVGGRVLNSSLTTNQKTTYGFLRIKVPVDKFEETNQKVVSTADEVIAESVNAEDETGPAVAADTRIQDLQTKKLEKQVELAKAKTDAEKKALELQIAQLDSQINILTQEQNRQKQNTDYASVDIQAANNKSYFVPVTSGDDSLKDELTFAWESMRGVLMLAARIAIWVAIYALLWLPIVLLVGFVVGRIKKHQTPPVA